MHLYLEMGLYTRGAGNLQVERLIFILHLCFEEAFPNIVSLRELNINCHHP